MTNKNSKQSLKKPAPASKKTTGIGGQILRTAILLATAGLVIYAISIYMVSYYLAWTPPMPEPDLNQHWGSYPIDVNVDKSIRPFKIQFSDEIVNDLRDRLLHYRKPPPRLENVGFTYGFNSHFLTQVVDYWHNKYNFKERENYLNQYDHFKTNIQGLDIHFMHVMPETTEDVEVVPIILLHGWPGSFREFYEMIPKLRRPQEGKNFVFEIIVPSLPGFGYSESAVRPGLGPIEMAAMMNTLMARLGHTKYYIQGGDLGHTVGSIMATLYPDNVLGFHTNFPVVLFHPLAQLWIMLGSLYPSALEIPLLQDRLYPLSEKYAHILEESGYMHLQATKPDTVGSALTDSPAGLAAYILEKFSTWTNPEFRKAYDGNLLKNFSLTHLLDNLMIYWATGSITTSMRVYAETLNTKSKAMLFDQIPTAVPTRGIKFKYELSYSPDSLLKMKYTNYLHSTVVEDGGHFAALENPELMANDLNDAVDMFRKFHGQSTSTLSPKTVYDYTVKDIHGNTVSLEKYKGFVLIIVNVASECGLTDTNYNELNELYKKYQKQGLRILAFPCNQFYGQEPGTAKDILQFTKKREVLFDVFAKIEVNGDNADPLWKFLRTTQPGTMGDFIKWNFSKFIVDRNGVPVARMAPNVNPMELEPTILKYL